MSLNGEMVQLFSRCSLCGREETITMSVKDYADWQDNKKEIKDIIPNNSAEYYNRIIYGECLPCPKK